MPLYEQVASLIERKVADGEFSPGQQIYSIREVCEQFDVSDVTAKKALRRLTERGVVRTVNGLGVFVREAPPAEPAAAVSQVVSFLKVGLHPAPVFVYEIDLIQRELARAGLSMVYTTAGSDEEAGESVRQLAEGHGRCAVVFPSHNRPYEQSDYMRELRRLDMPHLVVESHSSQDAYVMADLERSAYQLTEYLYELGHRRICLATVYERKVAGFQRRVARAAEPVQHWIIGEKGKDEYSAHLLAQQVLDLHPRPTAVIASNDQAAATMVRHFIDAGVDVPGELSVATFDDHPAYTRLSPLPVTVVRHPFQEVAQEVTQWCQRALRGSIPGSRWRRELTGTLIIRDTTAPPPAD